MNGSVYILLYWQTTVKNSVIWLINFTLRRKLRLNIFQHAPFWWICRLIKVYIPAKLKKDTPVKVYIRAKLKKGTHVKVYDRANLKICPIVKVYIGAKFEIDTLVNFNMTIREQQWRAFQFLCCIFQHFLWLRVFNCLNPNGHHWFFKDSKPCYYKKKDRVKKISRCKNQHLNPIKKRIIPFVYNPLLIVGDPGRNQILSPLCIPFYSLHYISTL